MGIDVGYGILDYKLRRQQNLSLLERTNAREVTEKEINDKLEKHHLKIKDFDLVVMDVSFISVFKILPNLQKLLPKNSLYIILVKPQFEADKTMVGFGGIISNPDHLKQVLHNVEQQFDDHGFDIINQAPSKVKGTKGNQEYFYMVKQATQP